MNSREVAPISRRLQLTLVLPSSKSIAHRALFCADFAKGKSRISGTLESEDIQVMQRGLRLLRQKGKVILDCGDSGTTARFLMAAAVLRNAPTVITGSARLQKRPMSGLADALRQIGAEITYRGRRGHVPLEVKPLKCCTNCTAFSRGYTVGIRGEQSSQHVSALLLIAPLLGQPVCIQVTGGLVSRPYADMTIKVMQAFGVRVQRKGYREFLVKPQIYKSREYHIEGDASSASYFHSLQYLHGGTLKFENLSARSVQGDAAYPKTLKKIGGRIDMNAMPDAAITLAVVAALKYGRTEITNIGHLRLKESDRLSALETELRRLGVKAKVTGHSIAVQGGRVTPKSYVRTYSDHRMAMSFAVMGTAVPGIVIENPRCVDKSYPGFWEDLELAYLSPIKLGCKNLVLTGMRGAGKSYLGKKIARYLRRPFVDLDREIVKDQKMKITEVVRRHGWPYFRKIEQKICSRYAGARGLVIATGGGAVEDSKNMETLKKNGFVVFLFADPRVCAARAEKENRPPLPGENVWQKRRPLYLKYADVVWDNTSGKVIEKNLNKIF